MTYFRLREKNKKQKNHWKWKRIEFLVIFPSPGHPHPSGRGTTPHSVRITAAGDSRNSKCRFYAIDHRFLGQQKQTTGIWIKLTGSLSFAIILQSNCDLILSCMQHEFEQQGIVKVILGYLVEITNHTVVIVAVLVLLLPAIFQNTSIHFLQVIWDISMSWDAQPSLCPATVSNQGDTEMFPDQPRDVISVSWACLEASSH